MTLLVHRLIAAGNKGLAENLDAILEVSNLNWWESPHQFDDTDKFNVSPFEQESGRVWIESVRSDENSDRSIYLAVIDEYYPVKHEQASYVHALRIITSLRGSNMMKVGWAGIIVPVDEYGCVVRHLMSIQESSKLLSPEETENRYRLMGFSKDNVLDSVTSLYASVINETGTMPASGKPIINGKVDQTEAISDIEITSAEVEEAVRMFLCAMSTFNSESVITVVESNSRQRSEAARSFGKKLKKPKSLPSYYVAKFGSGRKRDFPYVGKTEKLRIRKRRQPRLHKVKSHTRVLQSGKEVKVRKHVRGNESLGTLIKHYEAR